MHISKSTNIAYTSITGRYFRCTTYVCMCGYIVGVGVGACVNACVGRYPHHASVYGNQKSILGDIFQVLHTLFCVTLLFETESLTSTSGLTSKLQWLAIEPWGSMHLSLISAELASVYNHTQLFMWKLGAEFRSSDLGLSAHYQPNDPQSRHCLFLSLSKKWSPIVTVIPILYMNKLRHQRSPPSSHS